MSFSYKPDEGCTFCGYKEKKGNGPSKSILIISIILALFGAAALFYAYRSGGFSSLIDRHTKTASDFIRRPSAMAYDEQPAEAVISVQDHEEEVIPTPTPEPVPAFPKLDLSPEDIENSEQIREAVLDVLAENQISADRDMTDSLTVITGLVMQRLQKDMKPEEPPLIAAAGDTPPDETPADETAAPPLIIRPENAESCNNQPSRFSAGMKGVKAQPNRASRVRKEPSVSAEIIGSLSAEQSFTAADQEAICNENYLWLKISIENTGIIGWTVEGDGTNYWLKPQE